MSLTDWLNNGWLVEHEPTQEEITELLQMMDRDLKNSESSGLDPDWRLIIAYSAALHAATAALTASGYRAVREAHHYRVIQSFAYTIKAEPKLVTLLDGFRKKRNIGGYERVGMVSDQEATQMQNLARQLCDDVTAWLKQNYSHLV